MIDTTEDIYSLTKPLKTLPLDSSIPSSVVQSPREIKPEPDSKLSTQDVQPEIDKGLAKARQMAGEAQKNKPFAPTQPQSGPQPAQKPSGERPASGVPEGYADRVASGEGGSATAANPYSSARGWHQFIDSTWLEQIRKNRPDLLQGRTEQEVLNLRGNKEISSEIAVDYAKENAEQLKAAGQPVTGGNLYLAHFLGGKGATNMLSAPGSDPAAMHMSEEAVQANPWVRGMTVDQLKKTMEIKANGGRVTSTGDGTDDRATRGREITSDPQYKEIAKRLLELHPGAPGLTFSNGRGQVEKSPEDNPWTQLFVEFAQYAGAILAASAVSGSKKGRITSIGAMGALANAINGVTEGNQQKYKNNIAKFEAQTQRMAEINKQESEQYKLVLEKYKDDQAALVGALRAKALEIQDKKVEESAAHGDAVLAETVAFHRAEMQHWADQIAAKGEPVFHNPDQDIYFNWMKEFREKNGRDPTTEERQAFQQQQLKEKKEATSTQRTDPRSAFFKTWHDKFVEDNGREPTSEEWGAQESKWKEASATARNLSPAQQEQQRQITAAQNTLQQLNGGKDVKLPGGQALTAKEWNEFQNLPAGSPMTPKQQQVMVPLLRLANKRLDQQDQEPQTSTADWQKDFERFKQTPWKPTQLSPEEETKFKQQFTSTDFFKELKGEIENDDGRKLSDEQAYSIMTGPQSDYDYRGAWKNGAELKVNSADGRIHWPDSINGHTFKNPQHPTAWMGFFEDATGKDPDELGLRTYEDAVKWTKNNMQNGKLWQPPPGAQRATPEQTQKFKDGQIVTKNKNSNEQFMFDAQHGYFIPVDPNAQNPSPG